jgi:hypothetical protein
MSSARQLETVRRRRRGPLLVAALFAGAVILVQQGSVLAARPGGTSTSKARPVPRIVSSVGPLGVMPTHRLGQALPRANGPLSFHGGVVQHGTTVYAIFWEPPCVPGSCPTPSGYYYLSPSYRGLVQQYFSDLATESYTTADTISVTTQYYDLSGPGKSKNFVSYKIGFGGTIIDHDTLPTSGCANYSFGGVGTSTECMTDAQIQAEVNRIVAVLKLPRGLGYQYFLYTPFTTASCFSSSEVAGNCYDPSSESGFCAYHSAFTPAGLPVTLYANMPYNQVSGCYGTPEQQPNGSDADPVISTTSHELSETMTDPTHGGWWNSSTGEEIGDQCAYTYGGALGSTVYGPSAGQFNQVIAGDFYWAQEEWSNRANACEQRNTYTQPAGAFKVSASPTHGKPVTFTSTVKDADGDKTFTYAWNFGDGGMSTAASPSHTYATAGVRTVTLVVTDPAGDAVRVVSSVKVA